MPLDSWLNKHHSRGKTCQQLACLADDASKQQVVPELSLLLPSSCHCSCTTAAAAVAAGSQPPLQLLGRLQKRVLLRLLLLRRLLRLLQLLRWRRRQRLHALHIRISHCLLPHPRWSLSQPGVCRSGHRLLLLHHLLLLLLLCCCTVGVGIRFCRHI